MSSKKKFPGKCAGLDWERIEAEYCAGQLSTREIGRQHGVTHPTIESRAKKFNWKRDLSGKVRQEISARLAVDSDGNVSRAFPDITTSCERETIEFAAQRGVEVVRQHRKDIGRQSEMVRRLVSELEDSTINKEEIVEEIEADTAGDRNNIRRQNMLRAVALPTRAGIMKDLAGAAKILIDLERRAFSLDESGADSGAPHAEATVIVLPSNNR